MNRLKKKTSEKSHIANEPVEFMKKLVGFEKTPVEVWGFGENYPLQMNQLKMKTSEKSHIADEPVEFRE